MSPTVETTSESNDAVDSAGNGTSDMRTTRFDRVSGLFLTLILFLGVIVSGLFLFWTLQRWARQEEIRHSPPTRTAFVDDLGEQNEGEFEIPSLDEYEALQEPALDATLVAVTDAVTETVAMLDTLRGLEKSSASTPGGSHRPPRPPRDGDVDIIPRFQRWQLNFAAGNIAGYAAQLDHFGIELGVVGGDIQGIDIVSGLSSDLEIRRVVDTTMERRLYFMWVSDSPLKSFEETLLQKAGVELTDRHLIRLIPRQLENELAFAELEFAKIAGHDSVTKIARTVFQCIASEEGYEFRIADQRYRTQP